MISIHHLGLLDYADALAQQEAAHAEVVAGGAERIFVVEHPAVLTLGRQAEKSRANIRASESELRSRNIPIIETERGGNVTYHGPGQLVVYPIVRIADHKLTVSGYVHGLEFAIIKTLSDLGIIAYTDPAAVGVWTDHAGAPRKIAAIGVRVKRGVTLHGLALNVSTELADFDLITPCGIADRGVTSLAKLLGETTPAMDRVATVLIDAIQKMLEPR